MVAKKLTKQKKVRIKAVLSTLKETTILLQGSKNKIIVKDKDGNRYNNLIDNICLKLNK